jgi:hypothetical protein
VLLLILTLRTLKSPENYIKFPVAPACAHEYFGYVVVFLWLYPGNLEVRKSIPIIVLLVGIVIAILALLTLDSFNSKSFPPSVTFAGIEPGQSARSAGFWVTNTVNRSIIINRVQVEFFQDGDWKILSNRQPRISAAPSFSRSAYSPELGPADSRKILVDWPDKPLWQVRIIYATEPNTLKTLKFKIRLAWRKRSLFYLRDKVYYSYLQGKVYYGEDQAVSCDVKN